MEHIKKLRSLSAEVGAYADRAEAAQTREEQLAIAGETILRLADVAMQSIVAEGLLAAQLDLALSQLAACQAAAQS